MDWGLAKDLADPGRARDMPHEGLSEDGMTEEERLLAAATMDDMHT